jgi:aspartate/glutamate racemase
VDLLNFSLEDQNNFIESLSNEKLLDMFTDMSGYSRNFMDTFTQKNGNKDELARIIKESLKILPAVGAGTIITSTNTSK